MLDYYILIKKINGILLKYHKVKNSFVGTFLPPFFSFFFFCFHSDIDNNYSNFFLSDLVTFSVLLIQIL